MSAFRLIASGVDVSRIVAEVDAHPEMWGAREYRTEAATSPHHGVPDVWLRWRKPSELTSSSAYREPHFSEFYPDWRLLPSLHPIVYGLMAATKATALGGILLTRIPPGGEVAPHTDDGWHATFYNLKAYLCLKGNPLCLNWVEDEPFNPRSGDVFEFSNQRLHSVTNRGSTDRVTCIICMRTEHEI